MRKREEFVGAKLTRMLSLPWKTEDTVWISSSRWAFDVRSQTEPLTLNPLLSHSFTLSLISVWFLEQICTAAPSAASSSTMAYLMNSSNEQIELEFRKKCEKTAGERDIWLAKAKLTQCPWFHRWQEQSRP